MFCPINTNSSNDMQEVLWLYACGGKKLCNLNCVLQFRPIIYQENSTHEVKIY